MSMLETFAAIKKSLARPSAIYTDARARHAALADHETPAALLEALRASSRLSAIERDAILVALVTENQRAPQPVWQSLLLAAFEPMLVRLRGRLGSRNDEERDLELISAFLEAVRAIRVGPFMAYVLRLATAARVFEPRRKEKHAPTMVPFEEETHPCNPFESAAEAHVAVADVVRIIEAKGGHELLDAMLATHGTDESLTDYVARVHADRTPTERASAYERLKIARRDMLADLRTRLAPSATHAA